MFFNSHVLLAADEPSISGSIRVQIKKDGHAASTIGTSKMATGASFGVMPEVKTL